MSSAILYSEWKSEKTRLHGQWTPNITKPFTLETVTRDTLVMNTACA